MAISWSKGTAVTGSGLYLKCIWAGGSINKYVAVGGRSGVTKKIATSPDGINWTAQTVPQNNGFQSVAFDGTTLVAVSFDGVNRVMTSTNAVLWTVRTAAEANQWADVCWSPSVTAIGGTGQFVAVGATGVNRVMTSPDGITWTPRAAASALLWASIDWSPSLQRYVATALTASASNIMTSADGITWATRVNPTGALALAQCGVVWGAGAGKFVAGFNGNTNHIISSADGITWTDWAGTPSGWGTHTIQRLAWGQEPGLFLGVSGDTQNTVVTSPDGLTWTVVTMTDGVTDFSKAWGCAGYSPSLRSFAVLLNADGADIVALGTSAPNSLTPTSGHFGGGYTLTIYASGLHGGFTADARVILDTVAPLLGTVNETTDQRNITSGVFKEATNVVVLDADHLTCTAPIAFSPQAGTGTLIQDVLVLGPNATTPNVLAYIPAGFTYLAPTVTNVVPNTGSAAGGTAVTITGTNLFAQGGPVTPTSNQMLFGTNLATSVVVASTTSATAVTPMATSATNPVALNFVPLIWSPQVFSYYTAPTASLAAAFTYTAATYTLDWTQLEFPDGGEVPALTTDPFNWFSGSQVGYTPFVLPFAFTFDGYYFPPGTKVQWTTAAAPTDVGWWSSIDQDFSGAANIIYNSRPKNPRSYRETVAFSTGDAAPYGGSPGPACVFANKFIYAEGGYTVGTTAPTIRVSNGIADRELARLPNASSSTVAKAVVTMLAAGGTVYLTTLDSGTNSTNWSGRVLSLNIESGTLTQIGATFPAGHVPYALAWHAGRLWCGTHRQSSAVAGKVFYFRPGIDSVWTDDYTLSTSGVANVASLASFQGKLYVGTTAAAGTFAKVLVRSELGAYTTADTGTGGVATANNGFPAFGFLGSKLYVSYWNPDTPKISKIRTYDGASWTTAYTGAGSTLVPIIGFPVDGVYLFALGGSVPYSGMLLRTTDGAAWSDLTAFLTQETPASTGLPVFGVVGN